MTSLHSKQYTVFVSILVGARAKAKITQQDLARRLDKPQSFVSKYERCERRLDVLEFFEIAEALDSDPKELTKQIIEELRRISL